MHSPALIAESRERFVDEAAVITLVDCFVDYLVQEAATPKEDEDEEFLTFYSQMVEAVMRPRARDMVKIIFDNCQSPIERIFFNSFLTGGLKTLGGQFVVYPPIPDILEMLKNQAAFYKHADEFLAWYNVTSDDPHVLKLHDYLDEEQRRVGKHILSDNEKGQIINYAFDKVWGFDQSLHIAIQPTFKGFLNGKNIRPDMFVWMPTKPEMRVVVECDGFAYHKQQDKFTSDRKRDRALQSAGIDVLRYSGSEIHADPFESSADLMRQLAKRAWGARQD